MRSYLYLFFNIVVFVPVLVLSLTTDVKPHKHWRSLLFAYLAVSVPFILWDIWAAQAGHWGFNSLYIYSWRFFGIPAEELLFFITVPFAMMYVWGVIKKHVSDRAVGKIWPKIVLILIGLAAIVFSLIYFGNGYTRSAMLATLLSILVIFWSGMYKMQRFWVFQAVLLALFLVFNSILTALPIITYGENSIVGLRIGTIPFEDFWFNFAFINLFLIVFLKRQKTEKINKYY